MSDQPIMGKIVLPDVHLPQPLAVELEASKSLLHTICRKLRGAGCDCKDPSSILTAIDDLIERSLDKWDPELGDGR